MKKLSLFIILGIISLLVILNNSIVYGQQQKIFNATSSEEPKFFAIQHSQSGSISEINQTFILSLNNELNKTTFSSNISRNLILELKNVSDKTIMFSDRPDRIVKS